MKLIFCEYCKDLFSLRPDKMRLCECGQSYGRYTDNINARIGGFAIPIGFDNGEFLSALKVRPWDGMGVEFKAFVIPKHVSTIQEDN
jgi:hypothetical protein